MDIYFDNAATTPVLPEVLDTMVNALQVYGNPSSLHGKGVEAERLMTNARTAIMKCAGLKGGRVIFTGGGTEANNLAIFGTLRQYRDRGNHIVTTQIEHPSVLETYRALEREGWRVTYVAPNRDGTVKAEDVIQAVADDTVLVSVMHVNNESGAIQPVAAVARHLKGVHKTLFHVDGIQAFGKIPNCFGDTGIDLYSTSGHKLGAPKGVGALLMRTGVAIGPLLYGGGQEFGLRSGTENIPGIVAFAKAAELAAVDIVENYGRVAAMRERLMHHLREVTGVRIHQPEDSSPYVLSASFPRLRGEVLVHALEMEGLFVSTGSACSTKGGNVKASHVLLAMGCSDEEITGTLRFSLARWNTEEEVERAAVIIKKQVKWLYEVGGLRK